MLTPSFVSNVILPGAGARKPARVSAQKASSQRRDRGRPGEGAGTGAVRPPASGDPGDGEDLRVWVMATAAG
ncbi:hypothetical protein HEK616_10570 [Streptomyces nigrescens]|uniref:Uncharacterized protein n=1 Tax=Streptomyces nigrescens TaxID=1920 RepID=A0ABM7ZMF9_STRNI|nr:hypothetical protein HEK616_10570 [Streptomyces nigrescens]